MKVAYSRSKTRVTIKPTNLQQTNENQTIQFYRKKIELPTKKKQGKAGFRTALHLDQVGTNLEVAMLQ